MSAWLRIILVTLGLLLLASISMAADFTTTLTSQEEAIVQWSIAHDPRTDYQGLGPAAARQKFLDTVIHKILQHQMVVRQRLLDQNVMDKYQQADPSIQTNIQQQLGVTP
jgi:hypothetical protein